MDVVGTGLTDVGCKRHHNEDAFLCDVASGLFIVADGMGGRTAGETASKVVVTVLPEMLDEIFHPTNPLTANAVKVVLREALCKLSYDLYQQSQKIQELRGLGSTAAVLLIHENVAYIAYVGDSPVYLLRKNRIFQISEDQTTAAALVRSGHLSAEAAEHHPLKNSLEEYIGKEGRLNPGTRYRTLQPGDRWLLCSDGLTKGVTKRMVRTLLLESPEPQEICQKLITTAKEADGSDNITAVVVDVAN